MQLELQAISATNAADSLLHEYRRKGIVCNSIATCFLKLAEVDLCTKSQPIWLALYEGFKDDDQSPSTLSKLSLSSSSNYDASLFKYSSFCDSVEVLEETLAFFSGNCLRASKSILDAIHSIRTSVDDKIEGADIAVKEWRSLRDVRHKMLQEKLLLTIDSFRKEVLLFLFCYR
jgi:hypothetical protein